MEQDSSVTGRRHGGEVGLAAKLEPAEPAHDDVLAELAVCSLTSSRTVLLFASLKKTLSSSATAVAAFSRSRNSARARRRRPPECQDRRHSAARSGNLHRDVVPRFWKSGVRATKSVSHSPRPARRYGRRRGLRFRPGLLACDRPSCRLGDACSQAARSPVDVAAVSSSGVAHP